MFHGDQFYIKKEAIKGFCLNEKGVDGFCSIEGTYSDISSLTVPKIVELLEETDNNLLLPVTRYEIILFHNLEKCPHDFTFDVPYFFGSDIHYDLGDRMLNFFAGTEHPLGIRIHGIFHLKNQVEKSIAKRIEMYNEDEKVISSIRKNYKYLKEHHSTDFKAWF